MPTHKILNITSPNTSVRGILSKELGISAILAQILINRGINTPGEADKFLNTKIDYLLEPNTFSDMHKAVYITQKTIKLKSPVMVCGDYDVDGVTAVVLLKETLSKMGFKVIHYLPHRIKDGYGLNKNALNIARKNKVKLLITADCGINNLEEVKELKSRNIEVIITDHHEPQGRLPPAASILNPKVKDSGYRYRDLAGVGVAYKFCQALSGSNLLENLDLVSIGTIADVVPLLGENRVIVKEGLSRISRTKRPGLKALIKASGIEGRTISADFVSFILGPRINASGRIDTADIAFNLLISQKQEEAERLAQLVNTHNRQRQKIEGQVLEEAQALIDKEVNFKEHKVIVIAGEDWHHGVLGIVASKLADRFYRPTILISKTQDPCRGSGRSIKSFHLFQALLECRELLNTFGGHEHAAGLLIAKDNIDDFKNKINRIAGEKLRLEDLLPSIDIDMEVVLSDLNEKIINEFDKLEPFGMANPRPLFYTRNLKLKGSPQILSRDTLKFWVSDGNITYPAIGFGMSSLEGSLIEAETVDLIYTPKIDSWQDKEEIILEVEDAFFN